MSARDYGDAAEGLATAYACLLWNTGYVCGAVVQGVLASALGFHVAVGTMVGVQFALFLLICVLERGYDEVS